MYLNELNEQQKQLFLDLSYQLTKSDGEVSCEEEKLMKQLCHEMSIIARYSEHTSVEEIIEKLATISNTRQKKIILLELSAIVMTDGKCADEEKTFLKTVSNRFYIDEIGLDNMLKTIEDLYFVYEKINQFLG